MTEVVPPGHVVTGRDLASLTGRATGPRYPGPVARESKSSLSALGSIELQTRRELIHARLREAISSGSLAPGTHLAEVELSDTLGVSRGTLREALRQLQQEGLLTSDGSAPRSRTTRTPWSDW